VMPNYKVGDRVVLFDKISLPDERALLGYKYKEIKRIGTVVEVTTNSSGATFVFSNFKTRNGTMKIGVADNDSRLRKAFFWESG
jgi:hypothetical protein